MNPGTKLGPYEITDQLGKGGMGEVYRAMDTRLDRTVAIKVLPEHLASDPQRRERFEREAKAVSSLNHPHICTLHDVGEQDGSYYLVMELVEGETLETRLQKGRLPLDKALECAIQIADALDRAHRKGVIHRDLKPGNIMLTKTGVKLLDFGLAKLKSDTGAASSLSQMPTQDPGLTAEGTILGTLQYMAPEQLEGKDADARTDIFAFGALVYEMVTGKRAFEGKSQASLIHAIMGVDPQPIGELEEMTPRSLDRVVRKSLAKDPDARWQTAADLVDELRWISGTESDEALASPVLSSVRERWLWGGLAVISIVTIILGVEVATQKPGPAAAHGVRRYTLDLPWQTMPNWGDFRVRISPQGTHLAFPGSDENRTTIMLRALDNVELTTLVSPSADPWNLTFSPDGEQVAFLRGRQLQTASVHGGQPVTIAEFPNERFVQGISWNGDGSILVAGRIDGLSRVPASGQEPQVVVAASEGQVLIQPFALPDRTHALVSILRPPNPPRLAVVDLTTGTIRELQLQGEEPIYAAATRHLVFRQGNELLAAGFDAESLELKGLPVTVASRVAYGPSLSDDGTLVYVAERAAGTAGLAWVDRGGNAVPIPGERRDYTHIALSPDGTRVLLDIESTPSQIYVSNLATGGRNLLSDSSLSAAFPIWQDNKNATFSQGSIIVNTSADGGGERQEVLDFSWVPTSWSPDGRVLAYSDDRDVWIKPRDGEAKRFLSAPANERSGRFSPNGKAMAYVSDESGEFQVYVSAYPDRDWTKPVSIDGGLSPIWSTDSSELYFRQGSKVMVSAISWSPDVEPSTPELLFDGPWTLDLSGHQRYDVAPDGRFLMVENSEDFRVVIVEGFFEELKRLLPAEN